MPKRLAAAALFMLLPACIGPTKDRGRVIGGGMMVLGAVTIATAYGRCESDNLNEAIGCGIRECTAVEAIARRVEAIDAGYRGGAFVADAAIAACL